MQGLLVVLVATLGLVHSCDQGQIQQCISAFTRNVGGADPSAVGDEQALNNVCNAAFPNLQTCLKQHTSGCNEMMKLGFEGITNAFEYGCGEGKEEVIEHGPCVKQQEVRQKTAACLTSFQGEMGGDVDQDTRCGYVETYVGCAHKAVKEKCGEDAAKYHDKISIASVAKPLGCQIGSGHRVTAGWTFICALIFAYLLM